jgi:hypothetical protein
VLGPPWWLLLRLGGNDAAQGQQGHRLPSGLDAKRLRCQAAQMPSESEPIEAKPHFFGPSKRQPLKNQPGRAAKRPLTSGWLPTDLGPGSAWPAGRGGSYQRRALGLSPCKGPRPPSARALAWFSAPSNPANKRGDRPEKRRRLPNLPVSLGKAAKHQQRNPPHPWEPVPGWRAATKGPAGPSHQAAWASGQTNPPKEPQLWRLLVWM